jgi:hypothetical protein
VNEEMKMSGSDLTTLAWLLAAIVISILVIALALQLSRPLANAIGQRVSASSITPSQTRLLARLLLCGLALVTTQAILRRPVALVLGGDRSSPPIEAGIAAGALAAVLLLLVLLYQTARPMVQALTLQVIDAAVPTVGAAPEKEPTRTSVSVVRSAIPSPTDAVTVVAPLVIPRRDNEATIVSSSADDLTLRVRGA